jgi:hypothetical protein
MAKLKWDQSGERRYETGVDHGVLYPAEDGIYPLRLVQKLPLSTPTT